jgi:hypothetical protein
VASYIVTVGEVYNTATQYLITHYNSLDLLGHAEMRRLGDTSLASWAIDWTDNSIPPPSIVDLLILQRQKRKQHYHFSVQPSVNSSPQEGPSKRSVLFASGEILGKVLATYTLKTSDVKRSQFTESEESMVVSLPQDNLDHQTLSLFQALSVKLDKAMGFRPTIPSSRPSRQQWLNFFQNIARLAVEPQVRGIYKLGRTVYLLEDMSYGFGPPTLAAGDIQVQFLNATVKHFLRPDLNHYTFLGESYTHESSIKDFEVTWDVTEFELW